MPINDVIIDTSVWHFSIENQYKSLYIVYNKLMLLKFYFKTNEFVNYNNVNLYANIYLFYLCNITFGI